MAKILVVEDHKELSDLIRDSLTANECLVDCVQSGPEALNQLRLYEYDLIILDLNLPGLSGIDVCRTFRQHGGNTPVLMLTGNRTIDDKELGFEAGADDYLCKPFHFRELVLRANAMIRRGVGQAANSSILTVGNISLYIKEHRITKNDIEINLLPKEFALMEFFVRHPNQVFSAEALIQRVWPSTTDSSPETIRSYITRLRSKLGASEDDPVIATVHGVGYKLVTSHP
ncbi:MAG: response regulator transcription factor [Cyanobacteria bacterium SZAS LIN-5]|nr:response regulator transcription factor [Cyanobacteria bacterium SZAS LIN-5]RTL46187.1 MAG: response regulator transcription factor [Candidatus Melainabacteria bacterium]